MSGVRVPHRPPFLPAAKMVNEAARLLFTLFCALPQSGNRKSSSLKNEVFLHFFTRILFSLACEVVSLRWCFIPLVKRSALLPVKLPPFGGRKCYLYSAASPLNFFYLTLIAAEPLPSGIFDKNIPFFLFCSCISLFCMINYS